MVGQDGLINGVQFDSNVNQEHFLIIILVYLKPVQEIIRVKQN